MPAGERADDGVGGDVAAAEERRPQLRVEEQRLLVFPVVVVDQIIGDQRSRGGGGGFESGGRRDANRGSAEFAEQSGDGQLEVVEPAERNIRGAFGDDFELVAPFVIGAVRVEEEVKPVAALEGDVEGPGGGADLLIVVRLVAVEVGKLQIVVFPFRLAAGIELDVKRRRARTTKRLRVGGWKIR